MARALVVDDSAYVRRAVSYALRQNGIEVVGEASGGREAIEQNLAKEPDVVVLDLQMADGGGLEALAGFRATRPVPTIVFAGLGGIGAELAIEALLGGALEVVAKSGEADFVPYLVERVEALTLPPTGWRRPPIRLSRLRPAAAPRALVIAGSTGAPGYVQQLLTSLPSDFPIPVLVIQHLPRGFSEAFAARLDRTCALPVTHGTDGALVTPGQACVLPAGAVTTLVSDRGSVRLRSAMPSGSRQVALPSASAVLLSASTVLGGRIAAVILSGMGRDGADAVPQVLAAGGIALAQLPDEAPVASMPLAAIDGGARGVAIGVMGRLIRRAVEVAHAR